MRSRLARASGEAHGERYPAEADHEHGSGHRDGKLLYRRRELPVNGYLASATNPSGAWASTAGTGGEQPSKLQGTTVINGAMVIWLDIPATVYGTGAILTAFGQGTFSSSVTTTLP